MSKCDNCPARIYYAKVFDKHWLGKDDCPLEGCEEKEDEQNGTDRV